MFRLLKHHDWVLILSIIFLAVVSLLTIFSAAPQDETWFLGLKPALFWQQILWFILGFLIIFFVARIDWQTVVNYRWIILGFYFLVVVMLLLALFFAPVIREARSWIVIGPLRFQPAELAKVALLIIFSSFFAKRHIGIAHFRNLFLSFLYLALPGALVLFQPDWGSTLLLFGIWIGFLLVSGIRWKHLFLGFLIFLVLGGLGWNFFLEGYHKERIIGFLEPSYDPLGINYSVIQSKIAIGSAGFWGKGFRQGTQTQLGFLTEPTTDFIFAAFIEEWGFLGGFLVITAFLILILRIIGIGLWSERNFSRFICLGTAILFLLEFVFNVGSNLGLTPVIGVTFPFFSYGGSSLLTKAFLIGMVEGTVLRGRL